LLEGLGRIEFVWARGYGDPERAGWGRAGQVLIITKSQKTPIIKKQ